VKKGQAKKGRKKSDVREKASAIKKAKDGFQGTGETLRVLAIREG